MNLNDRFAEWLKASYETVPSLHLASGGRLTTRSLAGWKGGDSEPNAAALRVLHEMGCNVTWLVTGEGDSMFSDTPYGRDQAQRTGATAKESKPRRQAQPTKAPAAMIAELEAVIEKWR